MMALRGMQTGLKQHRLFTETLHVTADTGNYYVADKNKW
jgi:hypothetical protein